MISQMIEIRNTASYDDTILDIIWVVGIVDRQSPCNFAIKCVKKRQVSMLVEVLTG